MKRIFSGTAFLAVALLSTILFAVDPPSSGGVTAGGPDTATVKDAIKGTMDIQFNTRTNLDNSGDLRANSPAKGAKDVYHTALIINNFVQFNGDITRQPNLFTKIIRKNVQAAQLYYNVTINVVNPKDIKQVKAIGKWVGVVPINTQSGAYELANGRAQESPLRFDVDSVGSIRAFKDTFDGQLVGKAEQKQSLASYTYKRLLPNGTTSQIVVKRSDPMRFDNLVLAKGPSDNYPRTTVNGRLDYDYETGNYYTDGIKFGYTLDGVDKTDTVTGSIKWVEDKERKTNGKGHYEFNLRWNEAQNKKASEADAFKGMSQEDAFFAVDPNQRGLTGNVEYVDTLQAGDKPDEPTVTASKVVYHIDAAGLDKQQIMEFAKLWLVAIGPINDE